MGNFAHELLPVCATFTLHINDDNSLLYYMLGLVLTKFKNIITYASITPLGEIYHFWMIFLR